MLGSDGVLGVFGRCDGGAGLKPGLRVVAGGSRKDGEMTLARVMPRFPSRLLHGSELPILGPYL